MPAGGEPDGIVLGRYRYSNAHIGRRLMTAVTA
jgi:hypothetical protein